MRVIVTAPVTHLCPYVDEVDIGEIQIEFNREQELHEVAEYLRSFAGVKITHEAMTRDIAVRFDAEVHTWWTTAGLAVEVVEERPSST